MIKLKRVKICTMGTPCPCADLETSKKYILCKDNTIFANICEFKENKKIFITIKERDYGKKQFFRRNKNEKEN